ncbi:ubiquinol-cytochrome c reductase iron-sulfur subunit [Cellulomonas fimi]|uniref:Cytochrome bc1 complex Rieske iron-sulfur subunit n=1 Tax=Cellulomonas fimi (strain ATCC 484 / DSM 20113 / JCM 1341 / CCUG 24087 / LMG 16345 / NBRC 15513 / NCIMB 8980 / NCTC 7547 / NRS-133) TaxID=590998 RepID=F4H689_CELFA|nr:Rieske (2Fe-2S) protein [Cellulomonas fimi]AEE44401.1 Rieske (2Fe-2S) iron-sulfur domain protein [Cellulomonas fimi ATCC 484]NNH08293.1 Rieske (2Fe-2S) protein [Cellulomonas fimi]VEH26288.1 Cytochrome b6-f complex iron-sulfur subunit [Cellulomonas fimi]
MPQTIQESPATPLADAQADPHAGHGCGGCLDRRQVLQRAGLVTVGVAAVSLAAACSSDGAAEGDGAGGDGSQAPAADGSLAQLADVPVGGALAVTDADGNKLLLVQPEAGTVVGLSAVCTHQGCAVVPDGEELSCPCHGSVFDLTGKNVSGPAPEPLPTVDVHVADGAVLLGKA